MTIDEAITFCNEKLKELRELKDTITRNAEVLERQGYNKAIDDFVKALQEKN